MATPSRDREFKKLRSFIKCSFILLNNFESFRAHEIQLTHLKYSLPRPSCRPLQSADGDDHTNSPPPTLPPGYITGALYCYNNETIFPW